MRIPARLVAQRAWRRRRRGRETRQQIWRLWRHCKSSRWTGIRPQEYLTIPLAIIGTRLTASGVAVWRTSDATLPEARVQGVFAAA